ncbi:uncharacterized protein LOC135383127 [Ornithodoros turicata]|uniref:uncharacterized protein LOC135383127 n=1 Tax=Ornithodoros turicata TaxID=34597 RepID=UPI00313A426B
MGCGGSRAAVVPLEPLPTYPQKDTAAAVVKPQQNSCTNALPQSERNEVSQESLLRYLRYEREIQHYEQHRILQSYQVHADQLQQLEGTAAALDAERQRMGHEMRALQSCLGEDQLKTVKQVLLEQRRAEELQPEQEDYLDALNRLEVCKDELKQTRAQVEATQRELKVLAKHCERLAALYQERDNLLETIFGSMSGSELEDQLALDLEKLQICKQQVDQTHFKWTQALLMVRQACTQLARALKKWTELSAVPSKDDEMKFYCVAETRNNLSAALQNLRAAQRYLHNVEFPYCTAAEVQTMYKAVRFIFTDMKSPDRYEHALNCYHTTYRRAGALKQWLERVITTVIEHDLAILEDRCHNKFAELRKERIYLIRQKLKAYSGNDTENGNIISDKMGISTRDSGLESDIDDIVADEEVGKVFQPERVWSRGSTSTTPDSNVFPTPVPVTDLAPLPSTERIFGIVTELRHQHHEQMKALRRAQDLRQARLSRALQKKIESRKHKRSGQIPRAHHEAHYAM